MTPGPAASPQDPQQNPPQNPFPGLRPFREEEEPLFFGRESQVDGMVDKLALHRLLAVVGTSGSGKSSLVNCGLIPALHRGLMASAGSAWRVATLRPGNRPLAALAEALARTGVLGREGAAAGPFQPADLMEATLRLGRRGLVDACAQARLDPRQRLLVVVDQFEELFRYRALADVADATRAAEDATAFVNLLLEAAAQREQPLYVVLTMRSDFLGDCAQFYGLPEAINTGQYLVPRMSRDERMRAIAGPLGVVGTLADPLLLTRLVNEVGDNPDQLSVLQHALNRTWTRWAEEGGAGPLSGRHYEAIGTMEQALDRHAEQAYAQLGSEALQAVCQRLFRAITDRSTDARGTRRPTRFDRLQGITGASSAELRAVIDVFRAPERSFLMPPADVPLAAATPVDISHESLMRVWQRLRRWSEDEARSAQTFRRLAETAELEALPEGQKAAGLLRPPDLDFALEWRRREQPNAAWAGRYREGYALVMDFLDRSDADEQARVRAARAELEAAARRQEAERVRRRRLRVVLPLSLFFMALVLLSGWSWRKATRAEVDAAQKATTNSAEVKELYRLTQDSPGAAVNWAPEQTAALPPAPVVRPVNAASGAGAAPAGSGPLVYLQYADPALKAPAEQLRLRLQQAGYQAPGTEQTKQAPSCSELRYIRDGDARDAAALAALLRGWGGWGVMPAKQLPKVLSGERASSTQRQPLEIWLAPPPDPAELPQLMQRINAATPEERRAAGQALQNRWTCWPAAVRAALDLFAPARIDSLSTEGRINALYFLTRSTPQAWDAAALASGRELVDRVRARGNSGPATLAELERLQKLLDAQTAAAGPGS